MAATKMAILEEGPLRFVIASSPTDVSHMSGYLSQLTELKVKHFCRAMESKYCPSAFAERGIDFHDVCFDDGKPPPTEVLHRWLDLVEQCFIRGKESADSVTKLSEGERVSVHCVAGLGRSSLLVAVALVEFCRLDAWEAVRLIRDKKRGAINRPQLEWLLKYRPMRRVLSTCSCAIC